MRIAAVAVAGAAVSGCAAEYLQHTDTISTAAGDAVAWNAEVQAAHNVPRPHSDNRIGLSGERAEKIYDRWLNPPPPPSPVINLNIGTPGAAGS